jgi:hypothetical protein
MAWRVSVETAITVTLLHLGLLVLSVMAGG